MHHTMHHVMQDVVNWRMLFDCDTLGVVLKRGDVLPGPGANIQLAEYAYNCSLGPKGWQSGSLGPKGWLSRVHMVQGGRGDVW